MLRTFFLLSMPWLCLSACINTEPPSNPFREPINYAVGESPSHMVTADLNADAVLDIIIANSQDNNISILFGKNDGSFPNIRTLKTGRQPRWVITGDFNEDQKIDLGVVNNGGDNIVILLNQGGGNFLRSMRIKTKRSPQSATVNDFNGDGHLDIAIVSRFDYLLILLGDGSGRFKRKKEIDTGAIPTDIISGDFNGNGLIDLLTANNGTPSSDLLFFWGKGDGNFVEGTHYRTGMNPLAVITADFNKDSYPDLLAVNGMGDSLTLFVSNAEGKGKGFEKVSDFGADGGPTSVIAHDFNGDTLLDLVVTNTRSSNISYLTGKKDGRFNHPPLNLYTGKAPFYIVTGDFNQDGRMDIAVTNNNEASMSVLLAKNADF